MTRNEFVLNNLKSNSDIDACAVLWLEEHGWYRESRDGSRRVSFTGISQAGQALTSGAEMRFTNGPGSTDDINVGFDYERDGIVFSRASGKDQDAMGLLLDMGEADEVLSFILEKLGLNAWGFQPSELAEHGTAEIRGYHLAEDLKKYYTVFRVWRRKVDAATDDFQLCRWDFQSNTYRVADANWVHRACKDIVPSTPSAAASEAYKHLLNDSEIQVATEPCTDYLPTANGDFRVLSDSDEITELTPEHFVVSRIKAKWQGEVHHPAVDAIFDGIEDETDRQAIKIFMGYSLTHGCGLRKALLLHGNPGSGKSTLCDAFVKGVIGEDNVKVFNLNQDFGEGDCARFGLQGWEGTTLAYCSEVGSGRIPDSGPFKSVIAGDPVSIDRKGKAKVSVTLASKIIMCTNHIPNFQDTSSAVLDRLLTIDMRRERFTSGGFDTSVFDDPTFGSAMLWEVVQAVRAFAKHDEASGRWYVSGEIPISEKSKALLGAARIKSNPVLAVVQEWYNREGNGIIGQQWSTFRNTEFDAIYREVIGTDPDNKRIGQTQTVNMILQNSPIRNPDTGEEEHFQLVNPSYATTGLDGKRHVSSIKGVVARFSYDTQKNKAFIAEAKDIAIRNRDSSGGGVILTMNPVYNSELVV